MPFGSGRKTARCSADDETFKGIAKRLSLSVYTVKSHIRNILEEIALTVAWKSRHFLSRTRGFEPPAHLSA